MGLRERLMYGWAALLLASMGSFTAAQTKPAVEGEVWKERPYVRLGGGGFWVDVLLPDERLGHYRGPRFVHGGMVSQVTIETPEGPRTFFRQASDRDEPGHFDANAIGLAEEFSDPVGFDEAVISERDPEPTFMKIGVGLLGRINTAAYTFWRPYPVKLAGPWAVVRGQDEVTFTQAVGHPGGWAYLYTVRVAVNVADKSVRVDRTLSNTGAKQLRAVHYSHHFFGFGGVQGIGAGYEVVLGWPGELEAESRLAAAATVHVEGGQTRVALTQQVPLGKSVSSGVVPAGKDARWVELRHRNGQSVVYEMDGQIDRVFIWGSGRVLCPETFTNIVLLPGEQKRWGGEYRFTVR